MTSENETFNEVFAEAMNRKAVRDYHNGVSNGMKLSVVRCVEDVVDYYAMRFCDAKNREVAELIEERNTEIKRRIIAEKSLSELRKCLEKTVNKHCVMYCTGLDVDCPHCNLVGVCNFHELCEALEAVKGAEHETK